MVLSDDPFHICLHTEIKEMQSHDLADWQVENERKIATAKLHNYLLQNVLH